MVAMSTQHDNFAQYWAEGPWSHHVERLHRVGNAAHSVAVFEQPAGAFPDPGFDEFHLQLIVRGHHPARVAFGSETFEDRIAPGKLFLAPPRTDSDYRIGGPHRFVSFALDSTKLSRFREQAEGEPRTDFGRLHAMSFVDPVIEMLLLRICQETMSDHPVSSLFLDDACNTIFSTLFMRSQGAMARAEGTSTLSDFELDRVCTLIEDRLEEGLSIADLAGAIGLPDTRFARAFRAATGQSPHQFVLRRRVHRACHLLETTTMPLAEVALAAGFASQSHMNDVFRQKRGDTPGRYRMRMRR